MDHQMINIPVFNLIIHLYNNNKINNYNKIYKIMLIWILIKLLYQKNILNVEIFMKLYLKL